MPEGCGNPLLVAWLKEWWDEAREKNSKGVLTYKKAFESMKACPITFDHPSEATQLYGLGPKLCDRLTAKLEAYCRENELPPPTAPKRTGKRSSGDDLLDQATVPPKKTRKLRPYFPSLRSGPYAIILALSTVLETSSSGLTKNETIDLAQPHCDSSFTAPSDPTKFYTAWNAMKTLQNKDLVYEYGRPTKRYALTEDGWETARKIRAASGLQSVQYEEDCPIKPGLATSNVGAPHGQSGLSSSKEFALQLGLDSEGRVGRTDTSFQGPSTLSTTTTSILEGDAMDGARAKVHGSLRPQTLTTQNFPSVTAASLSVPSLPKSNEARNVDMELETVHIPPGTYSVELIIDNREVRAKTDQTYIQNALVSRGVEPTTRSLPLGDALWVARLAPGYANLLTSAVEDGSTPGEILLGHIAERKRLDDLIGSIKDGRFHEQKFRLRRSGVPNVLYLIENIQLSPEVQQRATEMVNSAVAGTMVAGGFFVKRTRKLDDTIDFLARMTKLLRKKYEGKGLEVVQSRALGDGRDVDGIRSLLRNEKRFLTFDAFTALAGKSDNLTLRDIFLKLLMCTKGVTGDKAIEIQRLWKTPKVFVEALQQGEQDEAEARRRRKEMLFKAAGHLVGRKKIGRAVSAKVADIWGEA